MAIVKVTNSKAKLSKAINYISQEEKTDEKLLSGLNCIPENALNEMNATKEQFNKTDGRQYAHYIQSFKPEEQLTYQQAHQIAIELAENQFKGHEVLIATHKDKEHIHSHMIVNSVSFGNGLKFHSTKQDLEQVKKESNRLCEREGLSLTAPQKDSLTSFNAKKYRSVGKALGGNYKSYMVDLWRDTSNSLNKAKSKKEFINGMEDKGYKVNWSDTRKNITFITPEGKKVRANNLAKTFKDEKFTKEGMDNEIKRNEREDRDRGKEGGNNTTSRTEHEGENGVREHSSKREFREIEERVRSVEQSIKGNTDGAVPDTREEVSRIDREQQQARNDNNRAVEQAKTREREYSKGYER